MFALAALAAPVRAEELPAETAGDEAALSSPAADYNSGSLADVPSAPGDEVSQPTLSDSQPDPTIAAADPPAAEAAAPVAAAAEPASDPQPAPAPRPAAKKKPAPAPYKGVYYNNDFKYLDDPNYSGDPRLGESLKRMHCGDCWTWDLGGEYRLRQHNEDNFARSRLLGLANDNNFILQRTRLFANGEYGKLFRFYGEAIDATSSWEDFAPRTTEENRFDALNLFGDALLFDGDVDLVARVGRQELLYGAQRLISPLDWANTRRTFDGARLLAKGEDWDLDGFWTRPVPFGQHVDFDHNWDNWDESQEFMGLYATRKWDKDRPVDLYYLRYAEYDGAPQQLPNFDLNTFGARAQGKRGDWLWEMEGGYQFGDWGPLDHSAGFVTIGAGHVWSCHCWKPTLWVYYDWASGDRDPTDGRHETFNQLFPLGHKYFGYMDLVGRQNIQDLNFLATVRPRQKVELAAWWHIFHLEEARDSLYNAAGAAIRTDATGAAGTDVGQELDLTITWFVRPNADLQLGYCHFYAGDFIANTGPGNDADFYYTQFNVRF